MTRLPLMAFAVLISITAAATAQLEDPLNDDSNFAEPFGPLEIKASSDNDGCLTLTRQAGGGDAGIDWLIQGKTNLPLDVNHDQLTITPKASVDGGYYVASLLFFQDDGTFLAEKRWIEDTDLTTRQSLNSVKQFAADQGVRGATRYRLRIRINPIEKTDAGFVFDRITANASGSVEPE